MDIFKLPAVTLTTDQRIHVDKSTSLPYIVINASSNLIIIESEKKSRLLNRVYFSLIPEELTVTAYLSAYEGRLNKSPSIVEKVQGMYIDFERVHSSDKLQERHEIRAPKIVRRDVNAHEAISLYKAFLETLLDVRDIRPDLSDIKPNGIKGFNPLGTSISRPMGGIRVSHRYTR